MKKPMFKILASSILFYYLNFLTIQSQTPFFREIANSNSFDNHRINCLIQDHNGFIWVGTENGIYISDGSRFSLLPLPDTLSNKNITALFSDCSDNIWAGFSNGNILNFDKNHRRIIKAFSQQNPSKINCIAQTGNKTMLFGTYGQGIYTLKNDTTRNINKEVGLSDNYIYTLLTDTGNVVWAGTDDGINILNFSDADVLIDPLSVSDGLPDFIVKSIKKDNEGRIWIGMQDKGVCFFDCTNNTFITPEGLLNWSFGPVHDIAAFANSLWIATENSGIVEYQNGSQKLLNYQSANNADLSRINGFLQDKEGNIWFFNNSKIVLSFGPKLEFIKELNGRTISDIQALTVDGKDNIWFANEDGVFRYDPNTTNKKGQLTGFTFEWNHAEHKIMSLYEDPYKFIWVGTFGNGILRLNPETGEHIKITEKEGLINGNVLSIDGTQKNIWFATLGGVSRCEISAELGDLNFIPKFYNFQKNEGLGNNFIYHLFPDKENTVWFATDGSGVAYNSENGFQNISERFGFTDKVVYSVTGDPLGNIWMNVANEGLFKYDGEKISKYFNDPDHKNLSFSGIQANYKNELVIAYDGGIDVLSIASGDIIHYEGNAGLAQCNPNLNTLSTDSKGNVWIGTSMGLVKYAPSSNAYWTKPHSVINEVAVFLEKTNHLEEHSFSHNDNHFSFAYAGIWHQYPEMVEYMVKLEGHDIDWIKTKNNNVVYSDLKPGHYTFQVKSALYGNFEKADAASYSFTIRKPFWSFTWFYGAIFIILVALIYSYIKYRENKLQKKQEAMQEKIRFQFENLKSQINPHFLFNSFSTLIALIEINSEDAIDYVQELSALFRNVLEYKDQDLIPLETELEIAENYLSLQKKRFGDNLIINIQRTGLIENLYIPPLTLQLLIENAIKHNVVSKTRPLQINIYSDSKKACIFVKNNLQVKEKDSSSTGIGINNIISRYSLLTDKKVEITKTDSSFIVGLPFIIKS
jgi:ligand-binding sensor domain-containing protein